MERKHTPGPWQLAPTKRREVIALDAGQIVAACGGNRENGRLGFD
jgi:hypothetical protein